jgi:outer membrane protein assembly factor BamD
MKKSLIISLCAVLLLTGCSNEFNRIYKSTDYEYKYEYAKECFANGKYNRAITILQDIVTILKGTDKGQESLFMLAMSAYCAKDYETAAQYFKRYYTSYPKGTFAEMAAFYTGQSLYMSTPEPRLDQTPTVSAIAAFQEYLDLYPNAQLKEQAHARLYELQDKLVEKELYSAKLYYDLGSYFGNCTSGGSNYEACIITAQNAIKDYPYSELKEEFAILILRARYELARQSAPSKQMARYESTIDEYYGFVNEYPNSKHKAEAEKIFSKSKAATKRSNNTNNDGLQKD